MRPLPIGISNFRKLIDRKLTFVDKSLLIKEFLDNAGTEVTLITRPRRFGKTLNLSMLHHFFAEQVDRQPTKDLFNGLNISSAGEEYMKHQGQYPVISLSFKEINAETFESAYSDLVELLSFSFGDHAHILDSPSVDSERKRDFEALWRRKATESALKRALLTLTHCLYQQTGEKPLLLIDEYDTPIQAGYMYGYYDKIIKFMRSLFGDGLKDNAYLFRAVLTGILRVSKESLFSGLNNLKVYSVLNDKYSKHFGFTENEVEVLLEKAKLTNRLTEVKHWYNGYQIGNTVIYNPWSIVNCIDEQGTLQPYWTNTSDNQLVKELVKKSPINFKMDFESLIEGHPIEKLVSQHFVFGDLTKDISSVWSLLLMSGYLKPINISLSEYEANCQLAIPNREVRGLYLQIIKQWLANGYGVDWFTKFINSLLTVDMNGFEKGLQTILLQITSYHDVAKEPEAFYHGMVLGFIASLYGTYEIISNREAGIGRLDLALVPQDKSKLPIILEFKVNNGEELEAVAQKALQQIDDKKYAVHFQEKAFATILKVGIAFNGKEKACRVASKIDSLC